MRTPTVVLDDAIPSIDSAEAPIRWDLVARIRQEIAEGTYDTPEKLEAALRILQERLE
jgi:anti-sigma28 factor (negative regulator of flagellin synthesis)